MKVPLKLPKYLIEHPVCCYCGTAPTETRDHAPARTFFKGRHAPDGYEFPACKSCNAADRAAELVVAFHLHSMTENHAEFERAYRGLKNNFPGALPNPFLTPGQKARALSARGILLPGRAIPFAPIVQLAPSSQEHFHRIAGKLAKAIYYKHTGRPLPPHMRVLTYWTTADQPGASETIEAMISGMPLGAIGTRRNVDLGEQFAYRFNLSTDGEVMILTAGLSNVLFFTAICADGQAGFDFDKFLALPNWREAA